MAHAEEQYAHQEEDEDDVPLMAAAGAGATSIRRARTLAGVAAGGRSGKRSMGSSNGSSEENSRNDVNSLLGRSNTVNLGTGSAAARERRHVSAEGEPDQLDEQDIAEQQELDQEQNQEEADIDGVQYYSPHQQSLLSRHSSMPVSRATRRVGALGSLNEVSARSPDSSEVCSPADCAACWCFLHRLDICSTSAASGCSISSIEWPSREERRIRCDIPAQQGQ